MILWWKERYGFDNDGRGGRWVVTNGHMQFDVHWTLDGSVDKNLARHPGPEYYIVSPQEADLYAEQILKALNNCNVKNGIIPLEKHQENLTK